MAIDEATPADDFQLGAPPLPSHGGELVRRLSTTESAALTELVEGDLRELALACTEELRGQPEPARAARLHVELARLCEWSNDLSGAAQHLERALAAVPDFVPALTGARRLHLQCAQYREALALFDREARVTSHAKRRAMLYWEKGRLLEDRIGDLSGARQAYERAFELDPQNGSILKALECNASSSQNPKQLSLALERASNAILTDPAHRAGVLVQRANLLFLGGDSAAAAELYETALALDSNTHGALQTLERIYLASGDWQRLISALERLAEGTRDHALRANLLYRIAHIYADRLGNSVDATDALARAARAAPGDLLVLEELAHLYADREMFVSLINVQRVLVEASPEGAERISLLHTTGVLYDLLGREDEATQYLRAALESNPTHVPALQALGKLYGRREQWEELIAMHLAEATASDDLERAAAAHNRIAEILEVRLGRTVEAAEHHTRALGLVPGYPASFKALTRLYAESGQHRQLVRLYERAADGTPELARKVAYLFKVGSLWENQLSDDSQAAHAYRSILNLEPTNLGALHALQRVLERARR
jgi:tetratricopeptide (TPR) repeat protein